MATSNTLPDKLGEGRFAAEDFRREIHALSARFDTLRVDGPDYRHSGLAQAPPPMSDENLQTAAAASAGSSLDSFDAVTSKGSAAWAAMPVPMAAATRNVPLRACASRSAVRTRSAGCVIGQPKLAM